MKEKLIPWTPYEMRVREALERHGPLTSTELRSMLKISGQLIKQVPLQTFGEHKIMAWKVRLRRKGRPYVLYCTRQQFTDGLLDQRRKELEALDGPLHSTHTPEDSC